MGQDCDDRLQRFHSGCGASRQVQQQSLTPHPAYAPAECGKGCLAGAFGAHSLGQALNHPVADRQRGFRRHVTCSNASAARGGHETCKLTALNQTGCDGIFFVGQDRGVDHLETSRFQLPDNGRPGKVLALTRGRRVADSEYRSAFQGMRIQWGRLSLQASNTFSSVSRFDSSSSRSPSNSMPCVDCVMVCSPLLPAKSISKLPEVHVSTL